MKLLYSSLSLLAFLLVLPCANIEHDLNTAQHLIIIGFLLSIKGDTCKEVK